MQPSFEQLGLANQTVVNEVLILIGYHDIVIPCDAYTKQLECNFCSCIGYIMDEVCQVLFDSIDSVVK